MTTAKSALDGIAQSYNDEMSVSVSYTEFDKKTQNKSISTMFIVALQLRLYMLNF